MQKLLILDVFGVKQAFVINMKTTCIFFLIVLCFTSVSGQNSEKKILTAYKTEGKIYFDSVAKSTNNEKWYVDALYNYTRLEVTLKNVSTDTPYRKVGYVEFIETIDKNLKEEFNFPESYFERVRKRFKKP